MKDETRKKIEGLEESIRLLSDKDHSHDELGIANGFHDAEKYKQDFCNHSIFILRRIELYIDHLNEPVIEETINHIKTAYDQILARTNQIEKLVEAGVHTPNYPKQREQQSAQIQQQLANLKKRLRTSEIEIKLCELNEKIGQTDFLQIIRGEAEAEVKRATEAAETAERTAKDAQKVLYAAQNRTVQKGVEDSASNFGSLFNHHKAYESRWLSAFIIASIAVAGSVFYALSIDIPDDVTLNTFISLTKRLFLVSVPSVFLKLALTKYNAERSLRIIYGHREKVLEQYKSFEAGIGDDTDAKNNFRIEVARYIFSDPQSNYGNRSDSGSSEININPIMAAVDRASGGK